MTFDPFVRRTGANAVTLGEAAETSTLPGELAVTGTMRVPVAAPGSPAAGHVWVAGATLFYRDNQGSPATQQVAILSADQSWSGTQTFTGTLVIPIKADPGTPVSGELWMNSGGGVIEYRSDSGVSHTLANLTGTQTLTNKTLGSGTTISANVTINDGVQFALGTTTGLRIGTAATQKIGFFGVTPVVQGAAFTQTFATASTTHAARVASALTNNTGQASNTVIEDMSSVVAQAGVDTISRSSLNTDLDVFRVAIENNFSDLTDAVNNVRTDQVNTAQVLNGLIDQLQLLGLVA